MDNLAEIVFIIDLSGSMSGQEADIVGGFNSMLDRQREEDYSALVTTVLFNHEMRTVHDRVPLKQVPRMESGDYRVGGSTALLDAVGRTVLHIQNIHKYAREEDVPNKILFVIMTDGEENSSSRFSAQQIRKMVEERQQAGWEFMFIGADIDAIEAAQSIGLRRSRAFSFSKQTDNFNGCFDAVGDVMFCVADSEDNLRDDDWDILQRVFDRKKR